MSNCEIRRLTCYVCQILYRFLSFISFVFFSLSSHSHLIFIPAEKKTMRKWPVCRMITEGDGNGISMIIMARMTYQYGWMEKYLKYFLVWWLNFFPDRSIWLNCIFVEWWNYYVVFSNMLGSYLFLLERMINSIRFNYDIIISHSITMTTILFFWPILSS